MLTPHLLRAYAWMQSRHPDILWRGDASRREIALTFDDGPHPRDTPGVLETLAKHEVRATFFLIGKDVEKNQNLVKQIHAGGHEIGIHCYRHLPFPFERPDVLQNQLDKTKSLISQACGISPTEIRDVRPPYGMFTAKTKYLLAEWGYRLVMWNCIPPHFTQPLSWTIQQILEASIAGSIVVLHDGHGHGSKAAQIVETIVPKIKSQGFEFVTINHMQDRKNN
ncbi:MAG TPA: polysaccharide deacetylase family protein [Anaerolineales bacterium]|mgnify:FL=1|nr:polysaccharide deacetylase family protein [Anaerolineales bacterium]